MTSARQPLTAEDATAVFAILVAECAAHYSDRDDFILHQTRDYQPEWRFIGSLGFGGKFRRGNKQVERHDGRKEWVESMYVDCYPEDRTPDRIAAMKSANDRLDLLLEAASTGAP